MSNHHLSRILLFLAWISLGGGAAAPLSAQDAEGSSEGETAAPSANALETPSKIISTILYASSARVTRELEVPASVGVHTLAIGPLPALLLDDGVQAVGASQHRVLSVQVERSAGGDQATVAFRELDDRIRALTIERGVVERRRAAANERRARYRELGVVAPTRGENEIAPMPVEPESWQNFIALIERGMTSAWTEIAALDLDLETRDRELTKLRIERANLESPGRREKVRVIATVQNITGEPGKLQVTYEIGQALWYPEYAVQIDPDALRLEVSCYGVVHQATGEDWPEAEVKFSTAIPQVGATMPELVSWRIRRDRYEDQYDSFDIAYDREMSARDRVRTERPRPRTARKVRPAEKKRSAGAASTPVPELAMDSLGVEGSRSFGDVQRLEDLRSISLGTLRQSDSRRQEPALFGIPPGATIPNLESSRGFLRVFTSTRPEPVPSDGAPHRLLIQRFELPFTEERRAVPELKELVFRRLRAVLSGDDPCLAGSAAVFLDGAYLGQSSLPTTAPGEEVVLDLGVDEQLTLVRRQEDREEEVGVFTKARRYHTTVTLELVNHHREAKTIDLRERIPFTESNRISIDFEEDDASPRPTRYRKSSGLVDWSVSVPAGEKRVVTLGYSIDAPRDLQLTRTPAPQRLEEDDR